MKKKGLHVLLVIGILMIGIAGYLYFRGDNTDEKEVETSNINTTEEKTTEATKNMNSEEDNITSDNEINENQISETASEDNMVTTTEQKKGLPKDYVWDTERLGAPPQIIYDFAENQERFEYIVGKVDSIISEDDGFSTGIENNKIYYDSGYNNLQEITTNDFKKNINFLFENTKFYEFTKDRHGYWIMHYNQEEDRDRFIFIMSYIPGMTDEQAYEEGYYRVVGNWFFGTIWKI